MGETSSIMMIIVGFLGCLWFSILFIRGEYEHALPALLCLSASLLEISWVTYPEVNVYRNIAWNVNTIGLVWLLIRSSSK